MSRRFLVFMSCIALLWVIFLSIFAIEKMASTPTPYEFPYEQIVALDSSRV